MHQGIIQLFHSLQNSTTLVIFWCCQTLFSTIFFCLVPVFASPLVFLFFLCAFLQPWHSTWLAPVPSSGRTPPEICTTASPLALSRSLPNLSLPVPTQLNLHTNPFSSFYLHPIPWLLFFALACYVFKPSCHLHFWFLPLCDVSTYSTSSSNFEPLSLRWTISFGPYLLSHAHLGSSYLFSHFKSPQFLSPRWMLRRVLMLCVQMNRICSWAPHGPHPSKQSESVTVWWLKLPQPAKALSAPTQSC